MAHFLILDAERVRQIEREQAQRKFGEDKKYFEQILANPLRTQDHKTLGKQRFYTDEQIAEAEQWKRENSEEK